MTDRPHPSFDEIADLREGLLPGERVGAVAAHVQSCPDCRAEAARLDHVSALLAAEGPDVPMPPDVAAAVDDALARASAEREAGVPSLVERRTTGTEHTPRTRRWPWLAGAAAAVVIVGAAVSGIDLGGNGQREDNSTAERSAADAAGSGDKLSAPTPQTDDDRGIEGGKESFGVTQLPRRLVANEVPAYARHLVTERTATDAPRLAGCPGVLENKAATSVVSPVRWDRQLALLVIDRTERTAAVVDCATGLRVLYETGY